MIPETRNPSRRTLSQESWLRQRDCQDDLLHLFGSYGYRFLEMPVLEPTELFLRKSGGELASQMFSFLDPGSSPVSLRPEFTAPLMLHYLEQSGDMDLPVRWQYAGPVFRYDAAAPQSAGQFTQVGAELIGSSSVLADAELLSMAAQALQRLGLNDFTLELADLQVLHSLLDTVELSDRARTFIIGSIPQLRRGTQALPDLMERARQLHLTGHGSEDANLSAAIAGLDDDRASEVLKGFLGWTSGEAPQLGQRDPDEVVHRLLRKLRGTDEQARLERGLSLIGDLATIRGKPREALDAGRRVLAAAHAQTAAIDRLSELVELLQGGPGLADNLVVDFGLARGIAYYTGIIFEVTHSAQPSLLGGGGRYDALARALGSREPVPAAGFAYNLEALVSLTEDRYVTASRETSTRNGSLLSWPSSVLVLSQGAESGPHALRTAEELRREGMQVELDVCGTELSKALSKASKKGMARVIVIDREGHRTERPVG